MRNPLPRNSGRVMLATVVFGAVLGVRLAPWPLDEPLVDDPPGFVVPVPQLRFRDPAALEAERTGMTPEEAIYQGCLIRFRPIMMTTMAALLGAVPIALGFGAGGEARQPLGLVVVGGLLFSQLVTLYLTPVVYTYMAQLQSWLRNRSAAGALPEPAR